MELLSILGHAWSSWNDRISRFEATTNSEKYPDVQGTNPIHLSRWSSWNLRFEFRSKTHWTQFSFNSGFSPHFKSQHQWKLTKMQTLDPLLGCNSSCWESSFLRWFCKVPTEVPCTLRSFHVFSFLSVSKSSLRWGIWIPRGTKSGFRTTSIHSIEIRHSYDCSNGNTYKTYLNYPLLGLSPYWCKIRWWIWCLILSVSFPWEDQSVSSRPRRHWKNQDF